MYLDRNSGNLYGPKAYGTIGGGSVWGMPFSLKGENGAAGSKIHSGTANPNTSLGVVGDYYLNRTTGDLFGPKTASGWGTPINLRGTANVIATPWFTPQLWVYLDPLGGGFYKRFETKIDIPAPILNAIGQTNLRNFMNSGGTMIVYINNTYGIYMLPSFDSLSWNVPSNNDGGHANRFRITYRSSSSYGHTYVPEIIIQQVRYVLIPPGRVLSGVASAGGRRISVDELKTMSYDQAGAVFGWEE